MQALIGLVLALLVVLAGLCWALAGGGPVATLVFAAGGVIAGVPVLWRAVAPSVADRVPLTRAIVAGCIVLPLVVTAGVTVVFACSLLIPWVRDRVAVAVTDPSMWFYELDDASVRSWSPACCRRSVA